MREESVIEQERPVQLVQVYDHDGRGNLKSKWMVRAELEIEPGAVLAQADTLASARVHTRSAPSTIDY